MYVRKNLRTLLAVGAASLLAVVGLIAWSHKTDEPSAQPATAVRQAPLDSFPMNEYGQPVNASADNAQAATGGAKSGFASNEPAPARMEAVEPAIAAVPETPPVRRIVARRRHAAASRYRRARRVVVVRKRPFRRSVAIVAGSAAGGALIGGLAGGAKGAGIGALAAGTGGLIYDRLTHKKRVVVRR